MQKLFLASSADKTIHLLIKKLNLEPSKLKLGFITNAADLYVDKWWIKSEEKALRENKFQIEPIDLTKENKSTLEGKLKSLDIIYVSGGNTYYLQRLLIKSGGFEIIPKILANLDKIYIGSSAGSMITGPNIEFGGDIEELKQAGKMDHYRGMNIVPFEVLPHWGAKDFYGEYKEAFDHVYEAKYPIITLNNDQAVYVVGDKFEILENK